MQKSETKKSISARQTTRLGEQFAQRILATGAGKKAIVVALQGELGSGKTTFLQGFARGAGIKEKILSPTFVVMKRFRIKDAKFNNFYHLDCYRIQAPEELLGLGFKEIISVPKNIVVVEWADQARRVIPEDAWWIEFVLEKEKERIIKIIRVLPGVAREIHKAKLNA